ncbi:HlyD family secretion protein [Paraburkholderia elongata]|jgi:membrane fusion protein (multidrug efflux system)|uniref:HlyD family efflux transporter periplasmic adaptor subunit n=1 Tax=Paraburkholderia elongata TaxID=2675747 RepID=A0A972NN97_9BURK|nr:HlyD family secretion protein [Paraburkholderia elongata]NPT56658.1 HlyD family efflux transporter periplasmic adaptor subunit [Paraburkholderia elongata]
MTDVQTREDVQAQATRAPRIRKHKIVVAAIAGGILAAGGIAYSFMSGNKVSTDDAYTDGRAITVAPHVAGYVAALNVADNQFVHQGQVLIQVQCTDYMAARAHAQGDLESTEGQLASAQSELELAKISYPARFDEAQATLDTQRANLFKAQSEFLRQHEIPKEATTSHDVDYATAERNAADGQLAVAQAAKRIAEPVSLNIADAKAHVEQLQGALKRAQADLDGANLNVGWCDVRAPQDGWVTKRQVEKGDYVQVGQQLFSIVSPEVWVTANFKETELTHMRPGQQVSIAVDAYSNLKLKGHVDSIQLGSGGKFTAFPAENATGNFVKIVQRVPVKIVIDSGTDPNRPLPLNLSVEPTVELR